MIKDLQAKILELKRENDVCILAHSYQAKEIVEVADFTGDSYQLSVKASAVPNRTVLMCGVRFMAETVKLLSPDKRVLLSSPVAGCPMAEQMDREMIESVKRDYPGYTVVAYINTTAQLKTVCDVCVTSSSAVKIVRAIPNNNILFIPDCNKRQHPGAKLLVHPECRPEVSALADFVGSTSAIMDYARKSPDREFIIGTEISIAELLQYECPDKRFYPLSKHLICPDMKATTLVDVYDCVRGAGGEEIVLDGQTLVQARRCIDEMIRLGG